MKKENRGNFWLRCLLSLLVIVGSAITLLITNQVEAQTGVTKTAVFNVTDANGQPASGVSYTIQDISTDPFGLPIEGQNFAQEYVTDANGQIQENLPVGKYVIRLTDSNQYSSPTEIQFSVTETSQDPLTFDLQFYKTLTVFNVTDINTGQPVPGVSYTIKDVYNDPSGWNREGDKFSQEFVTDASGQIKASLPEGKYTIKLTNADQFSLPSNLQFYVTATNNDNNTFDLQVSKTLEVTVQLAELSFQQINPTLIKQITDVTLSEIIIDETTGNQTPGPSQTFTTDANGQVKVTLEAGKVYNLVNKQLDGYQPPTGMILDTRRPVPTQIDLMNLKASGDSSNGQPVPFKIVKTDQDTGQPIGWSSLSIRLIRPLRIASLK
ncbi:MSCRAMM family protein [Vaginisenegalia massiliensis]|uniref:MSCRAMM family protein n=1 Tax=Vaginisenegalia massiliensis TaxID=2058294 RepID=UPI000F53AB66|nr:prealbumin-like fold domain-containing protein [Vaginisenegalia massiliensis]